ncbi:P-loop containing nucleoside triphosphate hydrolase protein [Westerdykella ornata]|uniref:P-loop containing nucleoside triphosphate hydrolase protein n=1 Tax=Westerdykella ornata TaxID=318751 RepID=A0A6A6JJ61_WESOR|nr:P-loop containing nucleoside triphosphate hydrolase protein [Westerdykella ornata]KAF2276670.1 P-loop containing nucleoside triphosphate hydrolase protein [Westerdykella ornata]
MGAEVQTESIPPAADNIMSNLNSEEGTANKQSVSGDDGTPNGTMASLGRRASMAATTGGIHNRDGLAGPKRIRYRIYYKDEQGAIVEKSQYRTSKPDITPDPEEEADKDEDEYTIQPEAVFDIITHVTIRDVVATESVSTEAAAAGAAGEGALAEGTEKPRKTFKIRSIDTSQMVIRSKPLIEAIRAVVTYYPGQELGGNTITVEEPYYMLLHHQNDLREYFRKESENSDNASAGPDNTNGEPAKGADTQGYHDFKVLQAYLDAVWKKKIDREILRYKESPPKATFDMLWRLFKPGSRVFAKDDFRDSEEKLAGFIVRSLTLDGLNSPAPRLHIRLWYLDNIGNFIDRTPLSVTINSYEGAKDITTLPVYPVEIKEGDFTINLNSDLEAHLIERGKRCWKILEAVFEKKCLEVKYNGPVIGGKSEHYKGRAVVDPVAYFASEGAMPMPEFITSDNDVEYTENSYWNDEPIGSKKRGRFASYQNISSEYKRKHDLDDGHFFLFARRLGGFVLKTRQFRMLDINYIEELKKSDAHKNLQIPERRLQMIRALTEKVGGVGGKSWSADTIEGKGEGQIFLLHGPSGVGKTYTAECIAEMTGRPLLSLTCADIGTDETQMEKELAKWFRLSEQWQAILLIDEADVYFEKRASGQLQRNSLVSAFLRSMEYYHGILFLTTNRLGHIDDAILSRIHLIIEYEELTDETREKIWQQFFNKLRKEQENFDIDPRLESYVERDEALLTLKWNGREIRNAFQTAVALAEHEARTADPPKKTVLVRQAHLEQVVKMSAAFKSYMENFKGSEAKRAFMDGARMDEAIRQYAKDRKKLLDNARKLAKG